MRSSRSFDEHADKLPEGGGGAKLAFSSVQARFAPLLDTANLSGSSS